MRPLAWLAGLLILLSAGLTQAAPPGLADAVEDLRPSIEIRGEESRRTLAEAMRADRVNAVSLAVVDHGKIVWAKAYGMADVAGGRAATPRTLFQAASISKPVAATAALRLVEQGRLALDAPINSALTRWRLPDGAGGAADGVTLRRLLGHSAGLTVHGFAGYAAGEPLPDPIQILTGTKPANSPPVTIERRPGEAWKYSGGGFVLAQLAMVEAGRRPFPELMDRLVLRLAGMADSTYAQPLPDDRGGQAATGYRADGSPIAGRFHSYPEMAAAGLWTTPTDLARWAIALQQAYDGRSSRLLSQRLAREMLTPGLGNFGLGIQMGGEGQTRRFSHNGANEGFRSSLVGSLTGGRAIVVMANGDDSTPVIEQLTAALARRMGWEGFEPWIVDPVALEADARKALAGRYEGGATEIEEAGDWLYIKGRGMRLRMVPLAADKFILLPMGMPLAVERGSDGKVKGLRAGGEFPEARDRRDRGAAA